MRYWISDIYPEAMTGKVVVCCASKTMSINGLNTVLFLWTFGHILKLWKATKGYQITAFLRRGKKNSVGIWQRGEKTQEETLGTTRENSRDE